MSHGDVVALIPARGGSKGVPRKNLCSLGGLPLVAWAVRVALRSESVERVIVSTEDKEIAQVAREAGAEVPVLRPMRLAQDDSPDFGVWEHLLDWFVTHESYRPDFMVWLRPSVPFRSPCHIDDAVDLLISSGADWVRSVSPVGEHPFWMKRVTDGGRLEPIIAGKDEQMYFQRQRLPRVYRLNGSVDVARIESLVPGEPGRGDCRAYVMDEVSGLDIDTPIDLLLAEAVVGAGLVTAP